jgi:hypothetical protein
MDEQYLNLKKISDCVLIIKLCNNKICKHCRYGEQNMCMGESGGFCTDTERHLRAHSLWWQASKQGNEHAALLIGDAYYYGRVRFLYLLQHTNVQSMHCC